MMKDIKKKIVGTPGFISSTIKQQKQSIKKGKEELKNQLYGNEKARKDQAEYEEGILASKEEYFDSRNNFKASALKKLFIKQQKKHGLEELHLGQEFSAVDKYIEKLSKYSKKAIRKDSLLTQEEKSDLLQHPALLKDKQYLETISNRLKYIEIQKKYPILYELIEHYKYRIDAIELNKSTTYELNSQGFSVRCYQYTPSDNTHVLLYSPSAGVSARRFFQGTLVNFSRGDDPYNIVTFDFPGFADGDTRNPDSKNTEKALQLVYEDLKKRGYEVTIFGHCMGTYATTAVSGKKNKKTSDTSKNSNVILLTPGQSTKILVNQGLKNENRKLHFHEKLGLKKMLYGHGLKTDKKIAKIRNKTILIISGDDDNVTTKEQQQALIDCIHPSNKVLWLSRRGKNHYGFLSASLMKAIHDASQENDLWNLDKRLENNGKLGKNLRFKKIIPGCKTKVVSPYIVAQLNTLLSGESVLSSDDINIKIVETPQEKTQKYGKERIKLTIKPGALSADDLKGLFVQLRFLRNNHDQVFHDITLNKDGSLSFYAKSVSRARNVEQLENRLKKAVKGINNRKSARLSI